MSKLDILNNIKDTKTYKDSVGLEPVLSSEIVRSKDGNGVSKSEMDKYASEIEEMMFKKSENIDDNTFDDSIIVSNINEFDNKNDNTNINKFIYIIVCIIIFIFGYILGFIHNK